MPKKRILTPEEFDDRLYADNVKEILLELMDWFEEESKSDPTSWKLGVYNLAIHQTLTYMNQRELSYIKPKKIFFYDKNIWKQEYTMAYHVIMDLARHLGFDPLFFEILEKDIFIKTKNKAENFARHEPWGKSLFIFHQVLTTRTFHSTWGRLTETQSRIVVENFERLIAWAYNQPPNTRITKNDIDTLFKDSGWFYEKVVQGIWYKNSKFESDILKKFRRRIDYLKLNGLKDFISQFYDTAYERFYKKALPDGRCELYSLLHRMHRVDDFNKFLEYFDQTFDESVFNRVDFLDLFAKILVKHGYPIPF